MTEQYLSKIADSIANKLFFVGLTMCLLLMENCNSKKAESSNLTTAQSKILHEAASKFGFQAKDTGWLLLANHISILWADTVCLEFKRSSGFGVISNMGESYHFKSPSEGWFLPHLEYHPVMGEWSDQLSYDGIELSPLYKIGEYSAKGYPLKIKQLLIAILSFGPLSAPHYSDYDFSFEPNQSNDSSLCFLFDSKENDLKLNPIRSSGKIFIDSKTSLPTRLEAEKIEYNSITHGVTRKFGALPSYEISCRISFRVYENNLVFVDKAELDVSWVRNGAAGQLPRRPNPIANKLGEKEVFYVKNIFNIDTLDSFNQFLDDNESFVSYDSQYWNKDTVGRFYRTLISGSLSKHKPVINQFEDNLKKAEDFDGVSLNRLFAEISSREMSSHGK